MEMTMQSSHQSFRNKIVTIEAIEFAALGFGLWCLIAFASGNTSDFSFFDLLIFFLLTEGIFFGSWAIYNLFIRIARAGGRRVDIRLWILAAGLTGSYTFWAWTILDINRLIVKKLFYRGEAPVEYAWSARSKQVRKVWEQARKAGYV